MGIYYGASIYYGYSFNYDELKELCKKNDIEEVDYLMDEYYSIRDLETGARFCIEIDNLYLDDSQAIYYMGITLRDNLSLKEFCQKASESYDFLQSMIKDIFPKYFPYLEPQILVTEKIY